MSEKKYNGWTNYETWNVALWIDNEQGTHSERCDMAQDAWDETGEEDPDRRERVAKRNLSKRLKEWVTDPDNGMIPDLGATMAADLLGSALDKVDWWEIAENWLEDVDRTADTPEPEEDEEQISQED